MISSTVVADNSVMALYFMLLIVIPSLPIIKRWFKTDYQTESTPETQQSYWQPKQIQLLDIALSIAIAVALVAISFKLSEIIQHVIPQSMSYLRYWFLSLAINTCYLQHLHYWQWLFGEISLIN